MILSILFIFLLHLWRVLADITSLYNSLSSTTTLSGNVLPSTVSIETSYTGYAGCNAAQVAILKQSADDAQKLADAGLDSVRDEFFNPQRDHQQVDFSKQAAIEFFGPEKENVREQARIFGGYTFLFFLNVLYVLANLLLVTAYSL